MENGPWQQDHGNTGGQELLREWQRETWIGPWPDAESPFDEPDDAPELRDLRSEELNNRSGDFWRTHTNGYAFGTSPPQPGAQKSASTAASGESQKPKEKRIWPLVLVIGLCVVAIGLVLYYIVFSVQVVTVTGIEMDYFGETEEARAEARAEWDRKVAEVIELSGIRTGMPIFSLNAAEVERRIEQNPKLIFRYLEKDLPSGVTLRVQEREACAWMSWNGIFYTMDRRGTVMYEAEVLPKGMIPDQGEESDGTAVSQDSAVAAQESAGIVFAEEGQEEADDAWVEGQNLAADTAQDAAAMQSAAQEGADSQDDSGEEQLRREVTEMVGSLVRVDGLKIRSGTLVGQTLALEEESQRLVFDNLFIEFKVLGCTGLIEVADLSNLDSILLTTRDGFTVALGNSTNLHAKLRSMLLTREELLRRSYSGGVINVNLPETPIFSPAD